MRLAAELNFIIDTETESLIRRYNHLAANIAGERVREELLRVLAISQAKQLFHYLEDLGLIKGYRCPYCDGEVELHHTDDAGTKWFLCKKCRQYSNKPKSEERKRLEEALKPIRLEHINLPEP